MVKKKNTNTNMVEFENLLDVFKESIETDEFKKFQEDFNESENIFFIGNGGCHSVATHAASDVCRLTDKKCYALDNPSYLTSIANDYGYNNIFMRWFEDYAMKNTNSMVIGFSGSGGSKNVISTLSFANDKYDFKTCLLSGQKSQSLPEYINEVCFNNRYFHVHEILCMLTFYQLVHATGNHCPTIKDELIRKGHTEMYRAKKYKEI
jgi:phosphoheptose isomerase